MLSHLDTTTIGTDEGSLLAMVKSFLEQRGWTLSPGPAAEENPWIDRNQRELCKAAINFAVGLPGREAPRHRKAIDLVERTLIAFALKQHKGNQSAAAQYLGMHRNTLRKKMRELDAADRAAADREAARPRRARSQRARPRHSIRPGRVTAAATPDGRAGPLSGGGTNDARSAAGRARVGVIGYGWMIS